MDHHRIYNNAPLHWGYSAATPHTIHNTWVPPPSRGLKRSISESDCEDNYSETSSKDISPKGNDGDSCQQVSRKKRRGVIEKKRRDRINSSLSELKRLVPSAYEKQGSSKLEKAEILQLTVDHLKSINARGMDSMAFDAQRYAMDYHVIGFQECVSEVARYLATQEGMDIQNPLRTRLLSHLRCFGAQRELSAKSNGTTAPAQNWTPSTPSAYSPLPQSGYAASSLTPSTPARSVPTISAASPIPSSGAITGAVAAVATSTTVASSASSAMYSSSSNSYTTPASSTTHMAHYPYVPNLPVPNSDIFNDINTPTGAITLSSNDLSHQNHYVQHHDQNGSTYTDLSSAQRNAALVSIGYSNQYASPNAMVPYSVNGSEIDPLSAAYNANNKPYRPWGGEMAY